MSIHGMSINEMHLAEKILHQYQAQGSVFGSGRTPGWSRLALIEGGTGKKPPVPGDESCLGDCACECCQELCDNVVCEHCCSDIDCSCCDGCDGCDCCGCDGCDGCGCDGCDGCDCDCG